MFLFYSYSAPSSPNPFRPSKSLSSPSGTSVPPKSESSRPSSSPAYPLLPSTTSSPNSPPFHARHATSKKFRIRAKRYVLSPDRESGSTHSLKSRTPFIGTCLCHRRRSSGGSRSFSLWEERSGRMQSRERRCIVAMERRSRLTSSSRYVGPSCWEQISSSLIFNSFCAGKIAVGNRVLGRRIPYSSYSRYQHSDLHHRHHHSTRYCSTGRPVLSFPS